MYFKSNPGQLQLQIFDQMLWVSDVVINRHYCTLGELSLVEIVSLLRRLLASKRSIAASGATELTAVEDRFSSVLGDERGT